MRCENKAIYHRDFNYLACRFYADSISKNDRLDAATADCFTTKGRRISIKDKIKSNLCYLGEGNPKTLVFVTQKGHISGKIMKSIQHRLPKEIEQLKKELETGSNIGRIIETNNVFFVVYRKSYRTKVSREQFEELLKTVSVQLKPHKLKTTNEDIPQFYDLVCKYFPDIDFRTSSEWPFK